MNMIQRSEIVAVKLSEVCREEKKVLDEQNDVELAGCLERRDIQELQEMKNQHNAMAKALKTHEEKIEARVNILNAMKDMPIKIDETFRGYNRDTCEIEISLKNPQKIMAGTSFSPKDIVTSVMSLRNHKNSRIMKVAREGYEVVVEDKDDVQLQKFLKL